MIIDIHRDGGVQPTTTIIPNLIKPITLSKFRYSLHMLPKSLLIDVGNNMDTVKAAKNATHNIVDEKLEILASHFQLNKCIV